MEISDGEGLMEALGVGAEGREWGADGIEAFGDEGWANVKGDRSRFESSHGVRSVGHWVGQYPYHKRPTLSRLPSHESLSAPSKLWSLSIEFFNIQNLQIQNTNGFPQQHP